jgi:hypothetical protein
MGNVIDGKSTGQFTGGVGAHAVRYHQQMASLPPLLQTGSQGNGIAILIVRAAHPDVGDAGNVEIIVPIHNVVDRPIRRAE